MSVLSACAAAAEELLATRKLVAALEDENRALRERVETARRAEELLIELNASSARENDALSATLRAKNETIAAKDAVAAKQNEVIEELKRKKHSPWKRLGDVLIGVAISAILK